MRVGLETQFVFQRDGEGEDEVYGGEFGEEIILAEFRGTVPFVDMDPDVPAQVARLHGERGPGFSTVGVAFVSGGAAEGEGESDNETEDCEEEGGDTNCRVNVSFLTRKMEIGMEK
jgi:hypothetical protein